MKKRCSKSQQTYSWRFTRMLLCVNVCPYRVPFHLTAVYGLKTRLACKQIHRILGKFVLTGDGSSGSEKQQQNYQFRKIIITTYSQMHRRFFSKQKATPFTSTYHWGSFNPSRSPTDIPPPPPPPILGPLGRDIKTCKWTDVNRCRCFRPTQK